MLNATVRAAATGLPITRRALLGGAALAALPASVALAAAPDPLISLIERYRERMAFFNANATGGDEDYDALADVTYLPFWDELCSNPPAPTTYAGAMAGLEFIADELRHCRDSDALGAVLTPCLAFLRRGPQA